MDSDVSALQSKIERVIIELETWFKRNDIVINASNRNRNVGRAKSPSGVVVCLDIFDRWQDWHARAQARQSLCTPGQTNRWEKEFRCRPHSEVAKTAERVEYLSEGFGEVRASA